MAAKTSQAHKGGDVANPTFMVIGAQKCGTTWLEGMIRQHPQVFVSKEKELHFWDKQARWSQGMRAYQEYFAESSPQHLAVGECTPNYFWTTPDLSEVDSDGAANQALPQRVAQALPDLKFIVCLRDPTDRAISAYYHHIRKKRVLPSQKIDDVFHRYGIASMGHYAIHLEAWREHFPEDRFLAVIYEDEIRKGKRETLRRVFQHLGVDPDFMPGGLNARRNPRRSDLFMRVNFHSSALAWVLEYTLPGAVRHHRRWKIGVTEDERSRIREHFLPHNKRLEEMLGRTLPWSV